MSYFEFAGQKSTDFGLVIEHIPERTVAQRRVNTIQIPGRHGLLYYDTGAFEGVTQTYEVWFASAGTQSLSEDAGRIAAWLLAGKGYQVLRDSYSPDVFRLAVFAGPMDIAPIARRFGRVTLAFDCMPQRWLDSGQLKQPVSNGGSLVNQWMPAQPLIEITGTGQGVLAVGEYTVEVSALPASGITIDANIKDAYSGAQNANSLITVPSGFPQLESGANKIQWSGGITAVEITPRWWTL